MSEEKVFENSKTVDGAENKIDEITPKTSKWDSFMRAIDLFSDDFMEHGRDSNK